MKELSDGVALIAFAEELGGEAIPKVTRTPTTNKIHKLNNVTLLLNFLDEVLNVKLPPQIAPPGSSSPSYFLFVFSRSKVQNCRYCGRKC